ncbi:MAG TPA: ECF transporter S component [Armatimonadetes bacterium]|nr:ECF transporter S component [Armatimonadota bacterium]
MGALSEERLRELPVAGLLGAAGLALPAVCHMFPGNLGPVLLPMYLPVFVGGFLLSPPLAAMLGLLLPPLSMVITGMPPAPVCPLMMAELTALGGATALVYKALKPRKWALWAGLLSGIVSSRAAGFFFLLLLGNFLGIRKPAWLFVAASFITGLPGTLPQIIVVPPVVKVLEARRGGG